ncbi:MAG: hypothetical protein V2A65_07280 [Candidatus Omnitrophota bacterium]
MKTRIFKSNLLNVGVGFIRPAGLMNQAPTVWINRGINSCRFKFLLILVLFLLPLVTAAENTGNVLAKLSVEIRGKTIPINGAQVTVMDKTLDLEAIDIRAKWQTQSNLSDNIRQQNSNNVISFEKWFNLVSKTQDKTYHLYRYAYLVKAIENSRCAGRTQIRHGIVSKRTDHNGEVLIRYLKPGNYYLGAYRKRGKILVVWIVPFSIGAGQSTELTLNNSNAYEIYHPDM